MTGIVNRFYSGTPLIRSPMGQTNLYGRFVRRPKKVAVMTDVVAVRLGFTVFKCTLMIFMVFMIDITSFSHGPNPKEKWRCMELHFIASNKKFCMSELGAFLDTSDLEETCE